MALIKLQEEILKSAFNEKLPVLIECPDNAYRSAIKTFINYELDIRETNNIDRYIEDKVKKGELNCVIADSIKQSNMDIVGKFVHIVVNNKEGYHSITCAVVNGETTRTLNFTKSATMFPVENYSHLNHKVYVNGSKDYTLLYGGNEHQCATTLKIAEARLTEYLAMSKTEKYNAGSQNHVILLADNEECKPYRDKLIKIVGEYGSNINTYLLLSNAKDLWSGK